MRDAAVAACLLALAAAGCGSSGVDRVADRRWARAIVLQRSDLPAFDPQPPQGKGCLPGHLEAQTAFARSQRFDSLGQSAAGRAWIFRGESEARSAFRALVRRDYASCLRKPAVGPRVLAARQEAFGPRTGDRFRGLRIAVRLAQGGAPVNVYVDLVFVRRGRTVADIAFTSAGQPFGNAAESATLLKMTGRMEKPPTPDEDHGRSSLRLPQAPARA